eukprot:CAMPEP_0117650514 /NCGR_PEP_ID=MMETSP0804-20121206/1579_1 /TAXON_ID=1074897 /ORGANISM="Tetraselmis astigmatica, Strain CCMP880" /LENGTH=232 /DNA_ID=CAMNT_0005456389 /DNA_START=519 /DNA_END=1217 /DNA_ORIENTATION=-
MRNCDGAPQSCWLCAHKTTCQCKRCCGLCRHLFVEALQFDHRRPACQPGPWLLWRTSLLLQEFLEAGVLPAVLAQLRDSCEQVCVKALLALSAMVRGFYEASDAARSGGIVRQLVALASEPNSSIKSRRKSLQLLHYFCETFPEEKAAVLEEGLDAVVHCLNDTTDLDLIRAALSLSYLLLSDVSAKGKASDLLPALCKAEESLHQNFGESPDSISEEIDLVKQLKDLLLQY